MQELADVIILNHVENEIYIFEFKWVFIHYNKNKYLNT